MTIVLVSWFSLFNPNEISASDDSTSISNSIEGVNISLTSFIDPFSRWRIGFIQPFNKYNTRFHLGIDVGYGTFQSSIYSLFIDPVDRSDRRIYEVRPQIYYEIFPNNKRSKYISLELFYINHIEKFYDLAYIKKNSGIVDFKQANYEREVYGFNVIYSVKSKSKRQLQRVFYFGGGLRFKKNQFSNVIEPNLDPFAGWASLGFIDPYYLIEGTTLQGSMAFGLKLLFK